MKQCEAKCERWVRLFNSKIYAAMERLHLTGIGVTDPITNCPWCGARLVEEETFDPIEYFSRLLYTDVHTGFQTDLFSVLNHIDNRLKAMEGK